MLRSRLVNIRLVILSITKYVLDGINCAQPHRTPSCSEVLYATAKGIPQNACTLWRFPVS